MTPDPSDGSDRSRLGSGRLWTDPREEEEHTHWLAPRAEVRPPPVEEHDPPQPPAKRPRWQLAALATLIAFTLFGTGFLGARLLRADEPSNNIAALPAAPGAVAPTARSRVARSASPAVVLVRSQESGGSASGTGFLIDSDGTVVTAAHVVDGANRVQVRFNDNGASVDAQVLGSDDSSDLAALHVDPSKTGHVTPLPLADSDTVKVGDPTLAVGYPLGLDRTVTAGIVSAVGRAIQAPNGFSIDKVIQTDASINPGNSGGPLLDGAGRVIGVNSQIATTGGGGGNVGIGFAVPSNTVREVVPRLRAGSAIRRAYLGISSSKNPAGAGALVEGVVAGGPAQGGGVRAGDVVSRIAGRRVQAPQDVSAAIEGRRPGDQVAVDVLRDGTRQTLRVVLGTRPATAPSSGP